jgi:sodium-dependent dicarboxylate transporter 2/3/5
MNFFSWFIKAMPIALALLLITYLILKTIFLKKNKSLGLEKTFFRDGYKELGKISYEEKVVAMIFVITAVLWFTRASVEFGGMKISGWSSLFGSPEYISDGVVAIAMAAILFFIPSKKIKGESLLVWKDISRLPFDIILLFGGGFALAKGMEVSGLSTWLASNLGFASKINLVLFIMLMCMLVTVISEFASNVACIQLMLPILISLQKEMGINPLVLMIPATLAASLGFMLPVATAPNTIVFSSRLLNAKDMMKAGFWVDVAGIMIISGVVLAEMM